MKLRLEDVTVRYGDTVALNSVTLDVAPGITALVGPNAAGKSTLMKAATGHLRPAAGKILFDDTPVWGNAHLMAKVGYVPERDALYEFLTGHAFVKQMAVLHGYEADEADILATEQLTLLGMEMAMHRKVGTYSRGMRQLTKLAQALLHEPDLLLLDEPLEGCDPVVKQTIMDGIDARAQQGATVLIASHVLAEVESMTSRIALLSAGRLVASGDTESVRDALHDLPSTVRILTGRARYLAGKFTAWPSVEGVYVDGDAVDVDVPHLAEFLRAFHRNARSEWRFQGIQVLDRDLDSVYGYLAEAA